MTFHDFCKETLMLSWSNILFFSALLTTSQLLCASMIFHGCLLWLRFLHRHSKPQPHQPQSSAAVIWESSWEKCIEHAGMLAKTSRQTSAGAVSLLPKEGALGILMPSGEWQQQQDDHLILLKLGSSIGPSLISGTCVFVLCHSYLMDVQQSEWEAKGFI